MKANAQQSWVQQEYFQFTNGVDVDRTIWQSPQWISPTNNPSFFGRTSIRNVPNFGAPIGYVPVTGNAAQLQLSTYNPLSQPAGTSFLGAQIGTINKWGLASYNSVAFEAEVVLPISGAGAAPGGVVAALFAYNLISTNPFLHDEIDFEIAANHWQGSNPQINANVYVVTGQRNPNYNMEVNVGQSLSGTVVLRIEWSQNGVIWLVNGRQFYSEAHVPPTDMSLVLNFWAPDHYWGWAYNGSLQPGGSPGTQWTFPVNWAKVWVIAS
jgi:hypothetical protein